MSTQDVAADLVAMCRSGHFNEAGEKYWSDDVVSVEAMGPPGMDLASRGKDAVRAKGQWWADNHEVTNSTVEGPYVNGDHFAIRFVMDIIVKASGEARHMAEIGFYTVHDDKIVEERFLYGA